ncbi:MAG: GntR family transcriptional regulator [Gammaproteobacteria bacterium]|nr:GntR family transcriptional regulator [Gammaproteobacteria bacterium]MBU1443435.1 GntR family transcriptional regulator [Gammaproteobacteria bacterium]MBU2286409.1 GntR family transcriptional regulator [Gammaproteobacteria bacterium]
MTPSTRSAPSDSLANGSVASPVLYREVKRKLIADIASGAVPPGAALPNESELARRFGVSIGTLRRAVDELVAEHALVRQQGRGTFVGKLDRERFLFQFFKIADRSGGREFPQVRLHSFSKAKATAEESRALGIVGPAQVFRIDNVLSLKGRPMIHDHIVIDAQLFSGLTRAQFEARPGTIYELYQVAFGVTVAGADERLRAEPVSARTAELLGLEPGASVLRIERIARTIEKRPCEFRVSVVDTREVDYVSHMHRAS